MAAAAANWGNRPIGGRRPWVLLCKGDALATDRRQGGRAGGCEIARVRCVFARRASSESPTVRGDDDDGRLLVSWKGHQWRTIHLSSEV